MKTKHLVPLAVAVYGAFLALAVWRRFFAPAPALLPIVKLGSGSCFWLPPKTQIEEASAFARRAGCIAEIECEGVTLKITPDDEPADVLGSFFRTRIEREREEAESAVAAEKAKKAAERAS